MPWGLSYHNSIAALACETFITPLPITYPAVGSLPDCTLLNNLEIMDPTTRPTHAELSHPPPSTPSTPQLEPQAMTIGEGLPPVPGKLIKKIESGQFIELAELLPDRLGFTAASDDDGPKASKSKNKPIASIIEWIQCFGTYTAVLSKSQPHRVADLLGYQTLILQAYMEFRGDRWLGYDRTFRLKAATQKDLKWATIDATLWSLAFSTQGADRCQHCFSLHHKSSECSWDTDFKPAALNHTPFTHPGQGVQRTSTVCFQWNRDPSPTCAFKNCKFAHKCLYCTKNPKATDTAHKALYCPYRLDRRINTSAGDRWNPRNPGR